MNSCIWFRHDLRIRDNTALLNAAQEKDNGLLALYVVASETWKSHNRFWVVIFTP